MNNKFLMGEIHSRNCFFRDYSFERVAEMGLFSKQSKALPCYYCITLQPIGLIPNLSGVILKLDSNTNNLVIWFNKEHQVTLPYERILSFSISQTFVSHSNDKARLAGEILSSGVLGRGILGSAGRLAGHFLQKDKQDIRWIATLTYLDKAGESKQLSFVEVYSEAFDDDEFYEDFFYEESEKSEDGIKFVNAILGIIKHYGNAITEL